MFGVLSSFTCSHRPPYGEGVMSRPGTDQAVRRLGMLAAIFSSPSRAFLAQFRDERRELALDLGCGAGHSTRLVAAELRPRQTVGLDSSAAALRAARSRTSHPTVTFVEHDVCVTPFPVSQPDLMYSRFLLAHVPEPEQLLRRWVAELRPGGKLLLDEGTSIQTAHEPIGRYLEMLGALLQHRGTAVDIAGLLDTVEGPGDPGMRRCFSREMRFTPPASEVAAMFRANMDTWRDDPFIATNVGNAAVEWVEAELEALAQSLVHDGVAWNLKQIALERR
jgi:trans-aconitate 2-methyltransferase